MQRHLKSLSQTVFDVLIIGGGIYGACAAWDAALRGLSVALLEQGDFGQATSANTQRIIHGGLRYLQHGDLRRVRESIRERRILLTLAPHLVGPMPCLVSTSGFGRQGRAAMAAAFLAYDLIAWDRNRGVSDARQHIPRGRVLSRADCLRLVPALEGNAGSGGALWYDAQVRSPERLTLAFVRSAAERGGSVANYVRVTGFLIDRGAVRGVRACDVLTGQELDVRARLVLNTTGPWVDQTLGLAGQRRRRPALRFAKAINLVTRPITDGVAFGVPSRTPGRTGPRLFFITPGAGHSVVGTAYTAHEGGPDAWAVGGHEIETFLDDLNAALPAAGLRRADVWGVQAGLLPVTRARVNRFHGEVDRRYHVWDHRRDGIKGLISVVGVKYTTARDVAEHTVNLVCRKLGRPVPKPRSRHVPLWGGGMACVEAFRQEAVRTRPAGLEEALMRRLVTNYGTAHVDVLRVIEDDPRLGRTVAGSSDVLAAEITHAARDEMAMTLGDVLFRRTELATLRDPGTRCLEDCADLMAAELGWDSSRRARELEACRGMMDRLGRTRRPPSAAAVDLAGAVV